jgi:hypothetical protein
MTHAPLRRAGIAIVVAGVLVAGVLVALLIAAPYARRPASGAQSGASCAPGGDAGAAAPADGAWAQRIAAAVGTGQQAGLRVGVSVVDTRTGACFVGGDASGLFATASVVKVMIAAYLIDAGQLTGQTAGLAYSMIARSDDDAADALWSRAGGPALEPWIEARYELPGLGSPNDVPGRWGNTHVSAAGMAQLYARLAADPPVWGWLGPAMHDMAQTAKDGTVQTFGIPAVVDGAAVKQGWAAGSADDTRDAVVNSTGLVDGDRYAVVLLTEGRDNNATTDSRGFNAAQARVVTAMAAQLLASTR